MLSNRQLVIHLNNDTKSKNKTLNNGLPQGSVLAPLLFNLYISDLPKTASKQFIYVDDIYIANQDKLLDNCVYTLSLDFQTLDKFLIQWKLTPNPSKTETTAFHLNNKMADYNLEITYQGTRLKHVSHPKYLGVTLDRTLTFKPTNQCCINIIQKLTGTDWGTDFLTLRTSTIALVYFVAENCSPVWLNSTRTKKVDIKLNQSLHIISGTIKTTPLDWLPVHSNIISPPTSPANSVT
jgi:hypothetical protein